MKRRIKYLPVIAAASVLVAGMNAPSALANEFLGSIDFSADGVTTDNPILANATTFSLTGVTVASDTGEYATLGATNNTPVDFTGFKFNPPVGTVTPLWTFDIGSTVFSFDSTSFSSVWNPGISNGEWVILGQGVASISGFSDTPGTWTMNLSDSGNLTVGFDSTAAAVPVSTVPDGGNAAILLGGALSAIGLLHRKFAC